VIPSKSQDVSVVIPTYNRLGMLQRAVVSALCQDMSLLREVIIVDDGSTDGTPTWASEHPDPRVRLVATMRSGNIGLLRNRGSSEALGSFLAYLDSDDQWLPDKLERQFSVAPFRWAFGAVALDNSGRVVCGTIRPHRLLRDIVGARRVGVPISTLLVARQLFDEIGGFTEDPRLILREDWHFAVRLALADPNPAFCAQPLAVLGVHEERSTSLVSAAQLERTAAAAYRSMIRELPPTLIPLALGRWLGHRWRGRTVS